jgi:Doubled CXXCH motif (Paired_CXXCH_1)
MAAQAGRPEDGPRQRSAASGYESLVGALQNSNRDRLDLPGGIDDELERDPPLDAHGLQGFGIARRGLGWPARSARRSSWPRRSHPIRRWHPPYRTSHPAAAYSRESSCSDCHNQGQFCANCHLKAGLVSPGQLRGRGYHDAKQSFLLNHGQAARQNLESCVSCHSERDCLTCHSAAGGRRFNPHGPGFDPGTLRRKNPSMCTACHGEAIPER